MNKKVVWLVNEYAVPIAARTRQIMLSQYLEEKGYLVYIICGSKIHGRDKNLIVDNISYRKVKFDGAKFIIVREKDYKGNIQRALTSMKFQNTLWRIRRHLPRPDIIVSNFAGFFGNVFLKWKRKYGTKIIYDILDLWPESFIDAGFLKRENIITKILYQMEYISYANADGIIFSFEGGKDYIVDRCWDKVHGGKVDISNIGYLNNGVDLETFDRQRKNVWLRDQELDSDQFKAVYLGSIRKANQVDLIVCAARVLQRRGEQGIQILIYGDGEYRQELEDKAKNDKLYNIVFKGRLDVEYAPNMLSRCDINLFNFMEGSICRYGLSPNKLFMYLASGHPILSMVQPNYDIVRNRECGMVVDNNPEAVADGIVRLRDMKKNDIELFRRYSDNCRRVAEEFDYKNLVMVLLDQIEKRK